MIEVFLYGFLAGIVTTVVVILGGAGLALRMSRQ